MTKFYTGIGSRQVPSDIYGIMSHLGMRLGELGFVLRSGAAQGSDEAFEMGAIHRSHPTEIYLPWRGFNGHVGGFSKPSPAAFEMAATVHPAWGILTPGVKALHARNCHQVLGYELDTPSEFVVCWTPDGCTSEATRTPKTGGTATAIVLAERHGIPVYNLRNKGTYEAFVERHMKD